MAEVRAKATLDSSRFQGGINKMKGSVNRFSSTLASMKGMLAGAFSIGAIAAFTRSVVALGSNIYHNALQTRSTVEEYQTLERLWVHASSNGGHLARTLQRLSSMMSRALGGDATAMRGFENLGIDIERLRGMRPAQVLEEIARAQEKNGSTTEWAYGMYDVFGDRITRVVTEVLPQLRDGIEGVTEQMERQGQVMTTETASMLAQAEDIWADFFQRIKIRGTKAYMLLVSGSRQIMGGFMAKMRGETFMQGVQEQRQAILDEQEAALADFTKKIGKQKPLPRPEATVSEPSKASRTASKMAQDQLARIGASTGANTRMQITLAQQQRDLARQRNEILEQVAQNTARGRGLAA